ncbi:MAG: hypothetical protein MR743_05340, partial [Oscillospiraceae bacterium]|nr:hypothetical protein [Oscillospiraceae bacterium]
MGATGHRATPSTASGGRAAARAFVEATTCTARAAILTTAATAARCLDVDSAVCKSDFRPTATTATTASATAGDRARCALAAGPVAP